MASSDDVKFATSRSSCAPSNASMARNSDDNGTTSPMGTLKSPTYSEWLLAHSSLLQKQFSASKFAAGNGRYHVPSFASDTTTATAIMGGGCRITDAVRPIRDDLTEFDGSIPFDSDAASGQATSRAVLELELRRISNEIRYWEREIEIDAMAFTPRRPGSGRKGILHPYTAPFGETESVRSGDSYENSLINMYGSTSLPRSEFSITLIRGSSASLPRQHSVTPPFTPPLASTPLSNSPSRSEVLLQQQQQQHLHQQQQHQQQQQDDGQQHQRDQNPEQLQHYQNQRHPDLAYSSVPAGVGVLRRRSLNETAINNADPRRILESYEQYTAAMRAISALSYNSSTGSTALYSLPRSPTPGDLSSGYGGFQGGIGLGGAWIPWRSDSPGFGSERSASTLFHQHHQILQEQLMRLESHSVMRPTTAMSNRTVLTMGGAGLSLHDSPGYESQLSSPGDGRGSSASEQYSSFPHLHISRRELDLDGRDTVWSSSSDHVPDVVSSSTTAIGGVSMARQGVHSPFAAEIISMPKPASPAVESLDCADSTSKEPAKSASGSAVKSGVNAATPTMRDLAALEAVLDRSFVKSRMDDQRCDFPSPRRRAKQQTNSISNPPILRRSRSIGSFQGSTVDSLLDSDTSSFSIHDDRGLFRQNLPEEKQGRPPLLSVRFNVEIDRDLSLPSSDTGTTSSPIPHNGSNDGWKARSSPAIPSPLKNVTLPSEDDVAMEHNTSHGPGGGFMQALKDKFGIGRK